MMALVDPGPCEIFVKPLGVSLTCIDEVGVKTFRVR